MKEWLSYKLINCKLEEVDALIYISSNILVLFFSSFLINLFVKPNPVVIHLLAICII